MFVARDVNGYKSNHMTHTHAHTHTIAFNRESGEWWTHKCLSRSPKLSN